ncbi:macro domain-containing protein [Clostridium ljungdahlii]|uniref:O-acetyl-ADP-ribose deacetylase n=1 Tax=Clostridium ljungdahlii TaxID=1538 RepID=A0A168PCV6_9CLOT|nr:macro domain-containing protein [Clostridium ljungdahlii]OAA87591.1 O-acetyl-ADP-ribose deacetylase [Clostridium ljungdahlii]
MEYLIVNEDITTVKVDVIVNESNGVGYMGGILGKKFKLRGTTQSIQYATRGSVEREAERICKSRRRRKKHLPGCRFGYNPGEIFVTNAGNLEAKYIIHAVTVRLPGMHSNINIVKKLIPKIISKAYELDVNSIAVPLIGIQSGRIPKDEVIMFYKEFFRCVRCVHVVIVDRF